MLSSTSLRIAVSQLATLRWGLAEELCHYTEHGFDAISLWRPKLSDLNLCEARELLDSAGVRVSSIQWPGGFTGSEGQTFRESLEDAYEAIDLAEQLDCPLVVLRTGSRAGHTLSHARRLIRLAIEELAPAAEAAGVTLVIKPSQDEASFLTTLGDALAILEASNCPNIGLAIDLWSCSEELVSLQGSRSVLQRIKIVSVADRTNGTSFGSERLPPGSGDLPLTGLLRLLVESGYRGEFEFDPVGQAVSFMGYEELLASLRQYVDDVQNDMNVIENNVCRSARPLVLAEAFPR
ncbi:MAG: sugar phosphate isomerase/epimerase family protein [Pirellulales bacterium]